MKLLTLRRNRAELPGIQGTARVGRRTKDLCQRAKPGDIVVLDHVDLDRASAEALVEARVAAVVNASASISGRFPNLGPSVLQAAGIPLIDQIGADGLAAISNGAKIRVDQGVLYRGEDRLAEGVEMTSESLEESLEAARSGMATRLEAFSANAMEYLRRERDLLLDGSGVPAVDTKLDGRQVVLVLPGESVRADLDRLRRYIRDYDPVLVGVDSGADVLLDADYDPDLIIGDPNTMSDEALRSGAELVTHTERDGRSREENRAERLGLESVRFPATGTSSDVATLLVDSHDASLIVTCGAHASLVDLLDANRPGTSSTFLTRLRVGAKLVDARSVSQLYRARLKTWHVLLTLFVAVVALLVAVAATPVGQEWVGSIGDLAARAFGWGQGLFS